MTIVLSKLTRVTMVKALVWSILGMLAFSAGFLYSDQVLQLVQLIPYNPVFHLFEDGSGHVGPFVYCLPNGLCQD